MKIIKRLLIIALILIALLVVALFVATSSPFITKVLIPALQTEEYTFTLDDIDLGFGETNMTLFIQSFKTGYELASLGADQKRIKSLSIASKKGRKSPRTRKNKRKISTSRKRSRS